MSDYIPTGIIVEILARLPVKWILRYTAVCKDWHSIITNPNFVTTHLKRFGETTTNNQKFLNLFDFSRKHYLLLPDDDEFDRSCSKVLEFPFKSLKGGDWVVVGSCKGLVCLWRYDGGRDPKTAIIWNPCIRRSVTLTVPPSGLHPCNSFAHGLGFGFDLRKNVFKVVRFVNVEGSLAKMMVYEQGGEWREIACSLPNQDVGAVSSIGFLYNLSQVFLHGSLHWLSKVASSGGVRITALDMSDEVFKEIALPPVVAAKTALSLSVTKDSLAVFCDVKSTCSVWEMREYGVSDSWTHLYTIELPQKGPMAFRTLGFRENGQILLSSATGELTSFDPETKAVVTNTSVRGDLLKVENFVESLVLLTEGEKC